MPDVVPRPVANPHAIVPQGGAGARAYDLNDWLRLPGNLWHILSELLSGRNPLGEGAIAFALPIMIGVGLGAVAVGYFTYKFIAKR